MPADFKSEPFRKSDGSECPSRIFDKAEVMKNPERFFSQVPLAAKKIYKQPEIFRI
jgi:hypothetical protein